MVNNPWLLRSFMILLAAVFIAVLAALADIIRTLA
jgi:hypothetical protein